jgi:hypothetical protein
MSHTFDVNDSLVIDLLPGIDSSSQPALCLRTRTEPQQSIIIFLSEVYKLRDVLAAAGARLAGIEAEVRLKRKSAPKTGDTDYQGSTVSGGSEGESHPGESVGECGRV